MQDYPETWADPGEAEPAVDWVVEQDWADENVAPLLLTQESTVGEALAVVPGAVEIFERHGCEPTFECTEEHHAEYMLADTELYCHVDDSLALIDELNAALEQFEVAA